MSYNSRMVKKLSSVQLLYQKRYGLLFGGVFAAGIGSVWGIWAAAYLGTRGTAMIIISIAMLITLLSLVLNVRCKRPLEHGKLPYLSSGIFWMKFYGIVIIEAIVIFLIINWLNRNQLASGVIPTIAFIVAAHFAFLGKLNDVKIWYVTAAVICATIAGVITIVPQTNVVVIGGAVTDEWTIVSLSIFTLSLWATSVACSLSYLYGHPNKRE